MEKQKLSFNQQPIDRSEIEQSKLNIDMKTRSNLFAWRGQFSPQFIEALLNKYAADGFFVVDPFLGSGTTLFESARKGLSAYGIELNTSAYYMAKTYECSNITLDGRQKILQNIDRHISKLSTELECFEKLISLQQLSSNPVERNLLATLIVLLDVSDNKTSIDCIAKKWNTLKNTVLTLPYCDVSIRADHGDARHMNAQSNCSDILITSPPYINVFNYHQKYRHSVEALGFNVLATAKSEFGSNRKNRGNRFLTVIQYCIDMALSMLEANRVCKTNARMIYVVGRESSVLGYSFCNSELIYNIGTEIFGFPFVLRQERVFKNRYGQMIYEDILHFKNTDKYSFNEEIIKQQAKNIGVRMLQEKVFSSFDNKNLGLLENAIMKSSTVKKSEDCYA